MGLTAVALSTAIGGSTTAFPLEQLCRLDALAGPAISTSPATAGAAAKQAQHAGQPDEVPPAQTCGPPAQGAAARPQPSRQRHQHFWRDRRVHLGVALSYVIMQGLGRQERVTERRGSCCS